MYSFLYFTLRQYKYCQLLVDTLINILNLKYKSAQSNRRIHYSYTVEFAV